MKARVNKEECISCGLCVSTCPEVFKFDRDGKAGPAVDEISDRSYEAVKEARDNCPVSVIDIVD